MKKVNLFIFIYLFAAVSCFAQVGINTDGTQPDPSAGLEIKFINKGFLPPRMNGDQRNSIASPAPGLLIFNTDCNDIQLFNGSGWLPIGNAGRLATPGAITGNITPVSNVSGLIYSISAVSGATGYDWTVPAGSVITAGQGTTSITVTVGTINGDICVSAFNQCYRGGVSCLAINLLPPPLTVTTTAVSNLTQTTVTSGGNVTSDGGASIQFRGVCWATTTNPTLSNSYTTNGNGTGVYVSNLTGLITNTIYFLKAYAVNSLGTAYGNEVMFATQPTVTTTGITGITQTSAASGGNVSPVGTATITSRGICWSVTTGPTISDSHTTDGAGSGVFSSSLTGLTGNTVYYVRSYAANSSGVAYGNEQSFTTSPVLATVTTTPITLITLTNATGGGEVTLSGGGGITARGVCWSTSPNPTTANSKTVDGTGTGIFTSSLTGLTANTPYYVRAYVTNSAGTAYGNAVTFSTLLNPAIPTITTAATTIATATTATSGGNILSDGGASVIFRGVCWNTSPNPTLSNSYSTDGSGTGAFVSNITGLTPATHYYVRAYAVNSAGTGYGSTFEIYSFVPGQSYQGGVIFYVDGTGQHGLISATTDQATGVPWGCDNFSVPGLSTGFGSGQSNTTLIVNSGCTIPVTAAKVCNDLVLNGYSDWFLPAMGELSVMYDNRFLIGGFTANWYWSSSEQPGANACCAQFQQFNGGTTGGYSGKSNTALSTRAIRAF